MILTGRTPPRLIICPPSCIIDRLRDVHRSAFPRCPQWTPQTKYGVSVRHSAIMVHQSIDYSMRMLFSSASVVVACFFLLHLVSRIYNNCPTISTHPSCYPLFLLGAEPNVTSSCRTCTSALKIAPAPCPGPRSSRCNCDNPHRNNECEPWVGDRYPDTIRIYAITLEGGEASICKPTLLHIRTA